ncbi:hypothetical protein ACHAW5_009288 [Stephanodiscus triporus]|uniref:U2A'/phosphoprotein 32 family A C-terminal domain-containing protein n=1 Tax=Stephanodiscus triporus TaxID=2934178 RepID=A0ABD3NM25_9STRA
MRLSANILQSAEQRTNPLGEREILLRSLAIPAIEHLAVTRDQFDAIDMSNNHLSRLENFPRLERLSCLYLGGNGIDFVDGKNLRRNVPGLKTLILSGNGVRGWNVIADLGAGCPKLEFLSLVGNPVTRRQNYRLFAIYKIPTLKVLDFQKVKQTERERAQRLASSAAGAAMEADARLEARAAAADSSAASMADGAVAASGPYSNGFMGENGTNTFEPGEGKSAEESFATQFTVEEKAKIRDMVANAASAEEIDRIESLVKRGIFPGTSESVSVNGGGYGIAPPPPPPPPLPEDENQGNDEEGAEEDDDSKRQRTE